jgi:general secretion pathway protein G
MKRIRRCSPRTVGHGRRHSLALRAAHRGLTLLEIMIVIAILGLVMGLVVVPRVMDMFSSSKEKIAKLAVDQFAFKDGPQWQVSAGKPCPETLLVVAQFIGKGPPDVIDPWDSPYELFCGKEAMPPGAAGNNFAVMSNGPDKKKGTEDDIKSWEPLKSK